MMRRLDFAFHDVADGSVDLYVGMPALWRRLLDAGAATSLFGFWISCLMMAKSGGGVPVGSILLGVLAVCLVRISLKRRIRVARLTRDGIHSKGRFLVWTSITYCGPMDSAALRTRAALNALTLWRSQIMPADLLVVVHQGRVVPLSPKLPRDLVHSLTPCFLDMCAEVIGEALPRRAKAEPREE